jgi:hypothetical protein
MAATAAQAGAREAARRASCQNVLKQLGLMMKMDADASKGQRSPMRSAGIGTFMSGIQQVYPEDLTRLRVMFCPSDVGTVTEYLGTPGQGWVDSDGSINLD